jgi:hypothetical protein
VPQPVRAPDDIAELEADVARKDALVGQVLSLDRVRTLANAAACAGMLALDREGFAATVRQGIIDYPIIALLTRDANTVLDDEAAAALCNVTTHLVSAVALLSPAARLIDWGHCVPLDRSGPCRVDGTLLIPRTVTFFASVTSKVLAESVADAGRSIVRSLLESAPDDLDRMMFSTNIGVNAAPRGLLHNVRAIEADGVIEPAIAVKLWCAWSAMMCDASRLRAPGKASIIPVHQSFRQRCLMTRKNNDQRHRRTHRAQSRLRRLGAEFRR